jgi:hypothetical protein
MTHYYFLSEYSSIVRSEKEAPKLIENNYLRKLEEFESYLLTLPRIPVSGKVDWVNLQEVVEGKDFEFKTQILLSYGQGSTWYDIDTIIKDDTIADEFCLAPRRTVAIPLPKNDSTEPVQGEAQEKGKLHELKTWPQYFQQVIDGVKTFEYRFNDRGFREGDDLLLLEYDPIKKTYSGRHCIVSVTSVLRSFKGIEDGYCIMSILLTHGASHPSSGKEQTAEAVLKKHQEKEKAEHSGILFNNDETIIAAMEEYANLKNK